MKKAKARKKAAKAMPAWMRGADVQWARVMRRFGARRVAYMAKRCEQLMEHVPAVPDGGDGCDVSGNVSYETAFLIPLLVMLPVDMVGAIRTAIVDAVLADRLRGGSAEPLLLCLPAVGGFYDEKLAKAASIAELAEVLWHDSPEDVRRACADILIGRNGDKGRGVA